MNVVMVNVRVDHRPEFVINNNTFNITHKNMKVVMVNVNMPVDQKLGFELEIITPSILDIKMYQQGSDQA